MFQVPPLAQWFGTPAPQTAAVLAGSPPSLGALIASGALLCPSLRVRSWLLLLLPAKVASIGSLSAVTALMPIPTPSASDNSTPLPLTPYPVSVMRTPTPRTAGVSVRLAQLQRKPQRITITVPAVTVERLASRAMAEGRSLSNLAAFLLEIALSPATGEG